MRPGDPAGGTDDARQDPALTVLGGRRPQLCAGNQRNRLLLGGEPGRSVGGRHDSEPPEAGGGSGITGATSVSAGEAHTCVVLADGTAWCWGSNAAGVSGANSETIPFTTVPLMVPTFTVEIAVSGSQDDSYALAGDGTLVSWGTTPLETWAGDDGPLNRYAWHDQ